MSRAVIFDVGNVLIEWDVRHLYRRFLPDETAIDEFLDEVGFFAWNLDLDRGLPYAQGVADLSARFPHRADLIRAFDMHWMEAVPGLIDGTVALHAQLQRAHIPLYGLTNFSAEKWALSCDRFAILRNGFLDVVVSGQEGVVKPDPEIYRILLERNGLSAENCLFIDDSAVNVAGAVDAGMDAVRFSSPEDLARELMLRDIMP